MTTRITHILVRTLRGYAAGLLFLSLAVHLAAFAGFQPPGGNLLFGGLHIGVFPLVLALILLGKRLPGMMDVKTDNWRLPVFPGCPAWISHMTRGICVYALLHVAIVFLAALVSTGTATLSMSHSLADGDPSLAAWREFSAIWMPIYSTAFAQLPGARTPKG